MKRERYNQAKLYDYYNLFSGLKIFNQGQVHKVLLHFIVVSELLKQWKPKSLVIWQNVLYYPYMSLNTKYPSMKGHTKRRKKVQL